MKLIDVRKCTHAAIDAEWGWTVAKTDNKKGKTSDFLTVQISFSDKQGKVYKNVVFWNKQYKKPSISVFDGIEVEVIAVDEIGNTNFLEYFDLPDKLELLMFYSPKDLEATLGRKFWLDMLLETVAGKNVVNKMRRLNVADFKVKKCTVGVTDLIGMANSSLDSFLNSVGIDNPYKSLASVKGRDKRFMNLFMADDANDFLKYTVGDTIYLHKAMIEKINQINEIVEDSLGLPKPYTQENIKLTSGSLVADVFERWLIHTEPELFRASMMLTASNSNKDWGTIKNIRKFLSYDPSIDFSKRENQNKATLEYNNHKIKGLPSSVHGLAAGSIRAYYPGNYGTGTVTFGAVVQGGRCINERPNQNHIENVLDIDLSSCYGTALRDFDFPFGLPTVYGKDVDDEKMSLGDFLNKNGAELVDGLYQIYVSGELPFHQDLIHSKYGLTTNKIAAQLFSGTEDGFDFDSDTSWEREVETAHISGDFTLTTKQIELGVVTAENLKVIRAVSNEQELKGWMALTVDCAVYYPKSKETTKENFSALILSDDTRGSKRCKSDTRSNVWCRISLKGFIGKFIETRKSYKKTMYGFEATTSDYNFWYLRQKAVKLFINTTYGCFAAPYFPMGNTILANNITAKARTGVWMVAKSLNTVQSITDGGLYSCQEVHRLKTELKSFRKPGFNSLYLRTGKTWNQSVETKPLYDINIIDEIRSAVEGKDKEGEKFWETKRDYWQKKLDTEVTDYINEFWRTYELKMPFDIEHKLGNTGYSAGYTNSADYAIDLGQDKTAVKVRGARDKAHPKKKYVIALATGTPIKDVTHTFVESKSVGVSEWQQRPDETFLPGDDVDHDFILTPKQNPGFIYPTFKDSKAAKDKHDRAVRLYKKPLEGIPLDTIPRFATIR